MAVVMAVVSLVTAGGAAGAVRVEGWGWVGGAEKTVDAPGDLTKLRREAEKASKGLAEATKALERRQATLVKADKELKGKLAELQKANVELSKLRKPLADLVQSLYQAPSGGDLAPLFSGQEEGSLRALSDMTYLVSGRDEVLEDAGRLYQEQQKLAAQAQDLRANKLLVEAQLSMEIDTLRKRSASVVKTLTRTLVKLGVKVNAGGRTGAACDPTQVNAADEFPNGLLPVDVLCPLQQRGEQLRADAAIAFVALNEAYRKQFGRPMCVTDSYRSLGEQQAVFYRRPGFAAVPGRSNHGLGLAVDLCGGVDRFRSPQFNWLEANGKRFGWIHPEWAYSSPFEPWHWEYDPKLGSLL
ncbi:hypothetical protein GCM10009677_61160 [Sphaerisporangium rubeum]|uniref:Prefoldin subunit 5 n=1 Tax=Sphaerisporangium rubeum TaxID=321317 RepID=A0A7X0MAU4_9ACTN|nr:prefoldin subunit 5 [Sphaerisporangium rubeum]